VSEAPPELAPTHASLTGTWNYSANCGLDHAGAFTISNLRPDGTFVGDFFDRTGGSVYNGTIAGRLQSAAVTFTRHWSTPGEQQWSGTLDQTGLNMTGNITGYSTCTFSASKR